LLLLLFTGGLDVGAEALVCGSARSFAPGRRPPPLGMRVGKVVDVNNVESLFEQ